MQKYSHKRIEAEIQKGKCALEVMFSRQFIFWVFTQMNANKHKYKHKQIGRAHVWTPVTVPYLVCRLLLEKKKKTKNNNNNKKKTKLIHPEKLYPEIQTTRYSHYLFHIQQHLLLPSFPWTNITYTTQQTKTDTTPRKPRLTTIVH